MMALDIPMPESPGESLIKGLNTGGDLIHKLMLTKYYNTLHPSGDVANAIYVEQLRNQYGEKDPRYIEAKRAHDLILKGRESLMNYRDVLNSTAGIRATSPLGKEIAEGKGQGAQDILNNNAGSTTGNDYSYNPDGSNVTASPEEVDKMANGEGAYTNSNSRTPEERTAYERSINKKTSDSQARNTLIRADNLDKTRNSINVDDLTRYSGLKGTGKYLYDSGQAARGNPSDEYLAHQQAVSAATLMADQMRQFYGDSIQPSAMNRLRHLSNPSTWYKDPKVAKAQWEQLNKILDTETQTYREKGTSPIHLNSLDFKNGNFVLGSSKGNKNIENSPQQDNAGRSGVLKSDYLDKLEPQLVRINPQWTAKNIRTTAKAMNMTTDQVVNQLLAKPGGQ